MFVVFGGLKEEDDRDSIDISLGTCGYIWGYFCEACVSWTHTHRKAMTSYTFRSCDWARTGTACRIFKDDMTHSKIANMGKAGSHGIPVFERMKSCITMSAFLLSPETKYQEPGQGSKFYDWDSKWRYTGIKCLSLSLPIFLPLHIPTAIPPALRGSKRVTTQPPTDQFPADIGIACDCLYIQATFRKLYKYYKHCNIYSDSL